MAKKTTIDTILRTKLYRPPVPRDYVHRPRLLEYLDQRRERPVTLVSAPAGYGKSVLISSWLETCDIPNAWLSLDEHENDLRQFLFYFLTAIQTLFPDAVSETTTLANASSLPPKSVLARSLSNELDAIERDFMIVLDDIHRIQEKSVYDLLTELLQHPPRPMHIVLIGRRDPNLPITSFRARNQISEVRLFDLRFTTDETATYLQTMLGEQIKEDKAAILAGKTEGWITGLRLAVLAMRRHDNAVSKLLELKGTSVHITEYLISEVLNTQSPAVRHYLLNTSILDRFCAPLCDALWMPDSEGGEGMIEGADFIAKLLKDNLFLIALDIENRWFRYHHLFRDLLNRQMKHQFGSDKIAALRLRASEWLEGQGLIEEAIEQALAAGDALAVARIVERNRHAALNADQWHVLGRWLDRLSPEIKQKRLNLLLSKAWIELQTAQVMGIIPIIERVEALVDEDSMEPALMSEINFFRGLLYYFKGDGKRSVELFTKALELLPKGAFLSLRSATEYWLSVALHLNGQKETAIRRLHQGILRSDSREGMMMSRLTFGLCFIHMLDGEYLQALQKGLRLGKLNMSNRFVFTDTWGMYVQGNAAFQMFDLDAARHHLSLVLENRYMANPRAAVDAMASLALTSHFMGKPEEADETIRLAQEYAEWTKASEKFDIVASCRARLALLRGDIDSATRWQGAFRETPGNPIMLFFLELPAVTKCRVLIAIGSDASLKGAMERLKNIYTEAKTWRNTCWMMEIMVLQALASYRLGQLEAALETLAQAVAMAMPGGTIRPFVELGRPMADLLKKLAEKSVAVDYVTKLLAVFRDVEAEPVPDALASKPFTVPSPSPQPLVEPLTNRELDVLAFLAQRLRNQEIADKLFVSIETVKTHLKNIYQKLNVSKRHEAVSKAMDLGIITRR